MTRKELREFLIEKDGEFWEEKLLRSKNELQCRNCGKAPLDTFKREGLMDYYKFSSKKSGSGTNFHSVYSQNPEVYDRFSKAEDTEEIISKRILELSQGRGELLDVACGTGNLASKLSREFKRVWALDISKPLLNFARSHISRKNINYIQAKAEKLPFLDESFDVSLSTWGSFSPNETLREMLRVTKQSGLIIRVSTIERDELTRLFPNYDTGISQQLKLFYESKGFSSESFEIRIGFDSLDEAKSVISKITGCDVSDIHSRELRHKILFQWLKK